jgi:hypothetical protein
VCNFKIKSLRLQSARFRAAAVLAFSVVITCIMAFPASLQAATYYVDFSGGADTNAGTSTGAAWQHVKGMVGCTSVCNSTTPVGGDTVIFKGGVTWTGWGVWELIGGSSDVLYTTDHTWFSGGSFTQPIFDNQGADQAGGAIRSDSSNHIYLNDLEIVNCGAQPGTVSSHYCLTFYNGNNISVTNCTFQSNDWITTFFEFTVAGSYSNFVFTGNDISHTSNAIWVASTQTGISIHTFNLSGNTFHDYHDNMVGGTHGNGLHYYSSGSYNDPTQYLDGMTFCNNRSYGDFTSNGTYVSGVSGGGMTAFFFFEGSLSGTVCNNDFSFSPVQAGMFNSLLDLGGALNSHPQILQIYNNSLVNGSATNAMSAAINIVTIGSGSTVTIENNIGSGMQNCIYAQDAGSVSALTVDYNLWNCSSGLNRLVSTYYTYSQWQGFGYDVHGVLGKAPSWVAAPGNEHLNAGSPAIGAGTNLTNVGLAALGSDAAGIQRPSSGAWDIGAFQRVVGPNPPSGLTVTVR